VPHQTNNPQDKLKALQAIPNSLLLEILALEKTQATRLPPLKLTLSNLK
jgi:hypothetical protein